MTEYGWGEFEIGIRIYFTDSQEKHIDAFHQLKLFHHGLSSSLSLEFYHIYTYIYIYIYIYICMYVCMYVCIYIYDFYFCQYFFLSLPISNSLLLFTLPDGTVSKKPVISEKYDTIVFENPSEAFAKKLMKNQGQPEKILHHPSVDTGKREEKEKGREKGDGDWNLSTTNNTKIK